MVGFSSKNERMGSSKKELMALKGGEENTGVNMVTAVLNVQMYSLVTR